MWSRNEFSYKDGKVGLFWARENNPVIFPTQYDSIEFSHLNLPNCPHGTYILHRDGKVGMKSHCPQYYPTINVEYDSVQWDKQGQNFVAYKGDELFIK